MLVHIYIYMYKCIEIYTCMHAYICIFSYGVHSHTYIHINVAVCCGVLRVLTYTLSNAEQQMCVAVCCGVLRCVAVCCSVLRCVAGVNIHTLKCRATAQLKCRLTCRKYAKTYKSHIFMIKYLKATTLIFQIHIVNEN